MRKCQKEKSGIAPALVCYVILLKLFYGGVEACVVDCDFLHFAVPMDIEFCVPAVDRQHSCLA